MKTLVGGIIGGVIVYLVMLDFTGKKMDYFTKEIKEKIAQRESQLIDEMNLRTDLINWIVTEGIHMDPDEFWAAWEEKATFINIITMKGE